MAKLYTYPTLCTRRGDLNKLWFVSFFYMHPVKRKMQRFKIHTGFRALHSADERFALGKRIIDDLTEKLEGGWSPFADKAVKTAFPDTVAGSLNDVLWSIFRERERGWRDITRKTYYHSLRSFSGWLHETKKHKAGVTDFTDDDANDYLDWLQYTKGFTTTTRHKRRGHLGTLFNLLAKRMKRAGCLYDNPFFLSDKKPFETKGQRPFNLHEVERIKERLQHSRPQLWLACMFVQYCFLRTTEELPLIQFADLDFERLQLTVRADISKNGKTQTVDLHPAIVEYMELQGWLNHPPATYVFGRNGAPGPRPWHKLHLSKCFSQIRDELGFTRAYSLYSFKHTGNSMLAEKNISLPKLRDQNRHCDIRVTDTYLKKHNLFNNENVWTV